MHSPIRVGEGWEDESLQGRLRLPIAPETLLRADALILARPEMPQKRRFARDLQPLGLGVPAINRTSAPSTSQNSGPAIRYVPGLPDGGTAAVDRDPRGGT